MPVQFPNFLSVPVRTPDYSGLGDIVQNYYAGKAMPKDDLIKAIQAQFAQPTAEETLKGLKLGNTGKGLSNQKEQLDINRLVQEAANQKAFEDMFKRALSSTGATPNAGSAMGTAQPVASGAPSNAPPAMNPALSQALAPQQAQGTSVPPGSPTDLDQSYMAPRYHQFDQEATGLQKPGVPDNAYKPGAPLTPGMPTSSTQPPVAPAASLLPASQPEEPHEIVVAAGSPHLAAIDAMWDNNPLSRAFLEKKGYKKTQDVKFNAKTGQTTIITKYPSGTITTKTVGTGAGGGTGEAPMTTANVTKQQNIVSAIDNTLPVINDILKLDKSTAKKAQWEPYPRNSGLRPGLGWVPGYHSASTNYESLVSSALDTLLGAYGLPKTNEGIETVKKQLLIDHGETDAAYKARLKKLVEDLNRRKSYASGLLKKTVKNPPIDGGSNQTYSSDEWESADEQ